MRSLIVDNYDSFTYNLHQLLSEAGCNDITVIKNDRIVLEKVKAFDKIVFSPGSGIPEEIPVMGKILAEFQYSKSILGVCLGHQAIGCYYGARLINLTNPCHGISSLLNITDTSEKLYIGIRGDIDVGRYHSWVIDEATLPSCLKITSKSDDGNIMSVTHRIYDIRGVQFHPESYITIAGIKLIKNWIYS
jgi:anthranilate synthase/aminodeoxychorismate synthase-like glutamine amidotransferase